MLKVYKSVDTDKQDTNFNKLSNSEQKDIIDYLNYRKSRGLNSDSKLRDVKKDIISLRFVSQKDLSKLDIKEVTALASLIKSSEYGDYYKNEILVNFKRYIKWKNPVMNLDDIRLIKNPVSERKIESDDLIKKEDLEKLIKHEPKMFWKAFLITQYEAGLRTKEVRCLRWEDIKFNSDGDLSKINIYSTKTKKTRELFVKEATFYLKKLREEQTNLKEIGAYIFHSKSNLNDPVNRANISLWMTRLSKRVLGREFRNYWLRHSRGNELYKLAKLGKISKDIALSFMGHSSEMSKVYTHIEKDEIKKMLKDQIYNIEDLPPEKKIEFEDKIKKQDSEIKKLQSDNKQIMNWLIEEMGFNPNLKSEEKATPDEIGLEVAKILK